ncbi:MAG TPA: PfkB family carbohydrate kinase [Patescibacteria group bacterium]|nr:PfkB family carbohydrate kinase [Patescibacteria group bacterium]
MYDVTTIGDIKLDVFIDLGNDAAVHCDLNREDCLMEIKYGEKIPVDSAVTMMAGSAPNVSIGIRRLGGASSIVSVLGGDSTATLAIDRLKKEGISTKHVTVVEGTRSSFSAILNFKGESTVLAVHEPHEYSLPKDLKSDWLFVTELGPKYKELYKELIELANQGMKVGINPGAIQLEERDPLLYKLIGVSQLLMLNKDEAQDLYNCPTKDPAALVRTMQELGPKITVVTNGRDGSYASDGGKVHHAPLFDIGPRVEATGAGDAFSTGLISALINGHDLPTALTWGSVNSGSVVMYVGPQEGLLTKKQITDEIAKQPEYKVETI